MTIYIFNECCQGVYCYNKIYRNTQVNERKTTNACNQHFIVPVSVHRWTREKQQIPVISTLLYLLMSLSFIVL